MKIIAHRGSCTEALENSWDAFRRTLSSGAVRIELDVHLTKDEEIIVLHDDDFTRTGQSTAKASELTRQDIEARIRLKNGEKVPFLDELFSALLSQIEFNVEIKQTGHVIVQKLAQLIQAQKWPHKIIVSSFHEETLALLAKDYPEIKVALLWEKSLALPFSFRLGPKRFMKKHAIRIFHPDARLVTPALVQAIKGEGWEIYPYIGLAKETRREELWSFLMTVGVDGLCTNYPREMHLWLKEAQDDAKRFESHRVANSHP